MKAGELPDTASTWVVATKGAKKEGTLWTEEMSVFPEGSDAMLNVIPFCSEKLRLG